MAQVDETKVTGRKYRLWDSVNQVWKRVSYWTHASDVEFEDGTNLVDKMNNTEEMIEQDYVQKEQLVFELVGNDLYITKTY